MDLKKAENIIRCYGHSRGMKRRALLQEIAVDIGFTLYRHLGHDLNVINIAKVLMARRLVTASELDALPAETKAKRKPFDPVERESNRRAVLRLGPRGYKGMRRPI